MLRLVRATHAKRSRLFLGRDRPLGPVGTSILRILRGETTGYGFALAHRRAAVGENDDLADDTENGRIRLCIDAGSSPDSETMGTAARETPASRAAVPKKSRLVASGAGPYGALSCFFRVIRPIAVLTGPAQRCGNAKPYPAVSQSDPPNRCSHRPRRDATMRSRPRVVSDSPRSSDSGSRSLRRSSPRCPAGPYRFSPSTRPSIDLSR